MRQVPVFVEADVGMAGDHATAAWAFDLDLWGCCGQGQDEQQALAELAAAIGGQVQLSVAELAPGRTAPRGPARADPGRIVALRA